MKTPLVTIASVVLPVWIILLASEYLFGKMQNPLFWIPGLVLSSLYAIAAERHFRSKQVNIGYLAVILSVLPIGGFASGIWNVHNEYFVAIIGILCFFVAGLLTHLPERSWKPSSLDS